MSVENYSHQITCGELLSSRRTFLTTATITVGGYLMTASDVKAATKKYDVDINELPAEWVRSQGGNIFRYAKFINKLDLDRISNQQVISVHARRKGSTWNTLPPSKYWNNISNTLKVTDNIASALKQDVKDIVSAYRSPSYNSRCPGAKPKSYHKTNVAIDVVMHSSPYKVYSVAKYYRDRRDGFKGGIGRYRSFTHIDTRGFNATW